MLGQRNAGNMIDASWDGVDQFVRLQIPEEEFLRCAGATPMTDDSRRSFHRFYFRGKALLDWRGESLGVYTTDLSRKGMGLLSPIQLFPKSRVQLQLGDSTKCQLEVVRCRRIGQECYECGTRFVIGVRLNGTNLEEKR
jgi:PilZ domain